MLSNLLLSGVRESAYRREFLDNQEEKRFMGSFASYVAAEAGAPPATAIGYHHAGAAKPLESHQIDYWEYPALFWVGRSLDEA